MRHIGSIFDLLKFDFEWVLASDDHENKISIWRQIFERGHFS